MKITIFLTLTLAAVYVAQAAPLYEEEAQGHTLEQEQDQGNTFQEPSVRLLVPYSENREFPRNSYAGAFFNSKVNTKYI